jgi:uncharacterized membrane protein YkvI
MIGFFGILLSGILFIFIGTKMMLIAHRIGAYSYQEFNTYLFGKTLGKVINGLTLIILFGVTSVMLSGTGAIFKEQFGISSQIGIFITLILCYFIMTKGLNGILAVNSFVVPMMIFFSFVIFIPVMQHFTFPILPNGHINYPRGVISPFLYVAFNLAMAQAVLVPLGKETQNEKVIKWGGFWGGIGLTFMLLASHFALSSLVNMNNFEIPMGEVIKNFGSFMHIIFIVVIYGEIITTLIGNVFGLARLIHQTLKISYHATILFILIISYFISLIGFGPLLTILYPIFGYIGLLLLFTVLYRPLEKQ